MSLPTVASLWIGGSLSFIEQVCLKSFADFGHRVILYTYGEATGVPKGVEVRDANAVFPSENYIRHKRSGSVAVHADAFRYRLIETEDVIWVDSDVLCVRPWDIEQPFIFGWEKPGQLVCNAVLRLPPGSEALNRLNALCGDEYPIPPWANPRERIRLEQSRDAGKPVHVSELSWGVWGPDALTYFLKETGEIEHALPQEAFYPVPFKERRDLLKPGADLSDRVLEGTYGVNLWNRRIRRRLITHENGTPNPESYLGRALKTHEIDPVAAPIPDEPPASELARRAAETKMASPIATASQPKALGKARIAENHESDKAEQLKDLLESQTDKSLGWLPAPKDKPKADRILVVTGMKNEAPFILEWIAYHKAIGVTDFLVYTNDCTDNTNAILDRLAEHGLVRRLDNPWIKGKAQKPQHAALKDAVDQDIYKKADWILTIDVDEFVNIHVGDGTFAALFEASNYPNVISLTWKFFGNGGIEAYEDRPVTEQFVRCAPEIIPKPRLGWGFKSMFHKSAPYGAIGVHRPMLPDEERLAEARWVNGSGKVMPPSLLSRGWRSTAHSLGYRLATLNHYVLRSAESYLVKRERGRINHTDQDQGLYYWSRRNYATETDHRIHERLPMMEEVRATLLADPKLASLHTEAVEWHKNRIERLKATPGYDDLFAELIRKDRQDALFVKKEAGFTPPKIPKAPSVKLPDVGPRPDLAVDTPDPAFAALAGYAEEQGGFFWQGPENAIVGVPGDRQLTVLFDSERDVKADGDRWPAEFEAVHQSLGHSVLAVMGSKRNWFRHPFVWSVLPTLLGGRFAETFDDVFFYGASMGAFGALTYAPNLPRAHVLAIAPQATLDRRLVPWDDRWGWTARLDWDGPFSRVDLSSKRAGCTQVVFDPYDPIDTRHRELLETREVEFLNAPFMGHGIERILSDAGVMEDLIALAARGKLEGSGFHRLRRGRRTVPRFQHDLISRSLACGKDGLARAAARRAKDLNPSRKIRLLIEELEGGKNRPAA